MRIESIDVYHVAMPMKERWRTAFGEMDAVESVLVRMVGDGEEGWGEAAPYEAPHYCPEFAAGAYLLIRDWLGPALLGREIASGAELQQILEPFKGNHFAKAALDNAWWDAYARSRGEPLWRLIGGGGGQVAVGADIAVLDDLQRLIDEVRRAIDDGFSRVKFKFRAGWGNEMVEAVRARHSEITMHVDCNSGFRLEDAPMFERLDGFGLAMIEQPLGHDDLVDHAALQERLRTPLCLDESVTSLDKARKALDLGACRWMNLKVGRVGGLTNAIAIHDLCKARGVSCWVGGMLESAVGQGPSLALATLDNIAYAADIFPTARLYEQDMSEPEIVLTSPGHIQAPEVPGHGFAPHPERLTRAICAHAAVAPRLQ